MVLTPRKQYADWDADYTTVYQPTDCQKHTMGSWTIASLNLHGQFSITGNFTRIPIELPPYIDNFTLDIECEDSSFSTKWTRDSSLPIPTYIEYATDGAFNTITI